jgi:predicted glycoside hydrolase/deacetylase ChbG (UPF0249 family)
MVRGAAAQSAAEYARRQPHLAVGLHVDLAEWACRDGEWITLYQIVPLEDALAVSREVDSQLESFVRLLGHNPTHLDSHQHLHRHDPVRSVVEAAGQRLGVPVREADAAIRYCGSFYGQCDDGRPFPDGITVENLIALVSSIPPGVTELGCHPADGVDLVHSMYRDQRPVELAALCDPRVRQAIRDAGVQLRSFANLRPAAAVAQAKP